MQDPNIQRVKIKTIDRQGPKKLSLVGTVSHGGVEKGSFTFYVLPAETESATDRLVETIKEIQMGPTPYLWVRVIGEAHGLPLCEVARENIWEMEKQQRRKLQKYLSTMSRTFFAMGLMVGGVVGFFLGRRA